jgi:hypothetical protein
MTKLAPRSIEGMNELPEPLEADVTLSSLDEADVGAIYVCLVSKSLLRQIELLPPAP